MIRLRSYRNSLLKNNLSIEVTDFGAGSRVFKSNKRQVSAIAKNAGISKNRAELLIRVVQYFKPTHILEIGTSLGIGTACLSLGNSNSEITTMEGCPNTAEIAKKYFTKFNLKNIEVVIGNFKTTLPKALLK